ncbi:unnamed protein product [Ranitomeya imitator]|uniref:Lens fiber membrane intrinsic protein n=1 Tax=Ranitomeya imitator TaxID=111125 RepID=A0ABN9MD43_9NEOB|nr:unnamed protein product [Ranitomeya imitator]
MWMGRSFSLRVTEMWTGKKSVRVSRLRLHHDDCLNRVPPTKHLKPSGCTVSWVEGLFCACVGNILLVVSTATDYWMQYRLSGTFAHQGLWRYCVTGKCYLQTETIAYWNATRAFMILSTLSCFAGIIAGSCPLPISLRSRGLTGHLLQESCSSSPVTLFVLLAMAIYTGVTVNFLGKRFGDWRFSWSYILGWVALLMTFFAGIFYMCAYRMHECRRGTGPR